MHNRSMDKRALPVVLFNLAYVLLAVGWVVSHGNNEFLAYIGVLLLISGVIWWVHSTIDIPLALLWCLSVWGAAHLAGGLVHIPESWPHGGETAVLYNLWLWPGWLKYDQLVHAYGFAVTTWLCWCGLSAALIRQGIAPRPTLGLLTLAAAASTGFGALNEVIEFIVTLIVPENNVGGYVNTALDLCFNLAGALIAAVWIRIKAKRAG
ncbi:MAG TPA: hypothetical protein VJN01_06275 [Xanthomonadales bacterium]|nr:hypothetical protein [Xanthomonadales bacterium]